MNINRETYETYFMLYADNELSDGMRREVEAFVEQNPDLKPELDLFLSLRLAPDTSLKLEDKSFLFREETPAAPAGMEEQMLLHLDGELPAGQVAGLEAAILSEPGLKAEWDILKQTRLQPDTEIRFPGREILYRHETKEVRIVRFRWIQYAAAAAVILVAGLLWLNQEAGPDTGVKSIAMNNGNGNAQTEKPALPSAQDTAPDAISPATVTTDMGTVATGDAMAVAGNNTPARQDVKKEQPAPLAETRPERAPREDNSRQIAALSHPAAETDREIATAPQVNVSPNLSRPVSGAIDQPVGMPDVKTDYATQALAGNLDAAEVYNAMDQDTEKNRKGFRGLVRKANRIINKVTNPELDRPVVKVANVEITLAN